MEKGDFPIEIFPHQNYREGSFQISQKYCKSVKFKFQEVLHDKYYCSCGSLNHHAFSSNFQI